MAALAARLAHLADGASRRQPDELRQELRQLRAEFVASQLEGARREGEEGERVDEAEEMETEGRERQEGWEEAGQFREEGLVTV